MKGLVCFLEDKETLLRPARVSEVQLIAPLQSVYVRVARTPKEEQVPFRALLGVDTLVSPGQSSLVQRLLKTIDGDVQEGRHLSPWYCP